MATIPERGISAEPQRLRRLALRYEALTSAEGGVVWVLDPELRPTGRNEAWEKYSGQATESYANLGWLSAIHPDDAPRVKAEAARALANREPLQIEVRIKRADGTFRRNLVRAVPVHDGDQIVEWIGTAADIEDARQAEDDLAAVEERMRQAHAAAGVGTWEWSLETNRIAWSREVFEMLQLDPATLPDHQLWNERIHPDDRPGALERWTAALASVATHFTDTFRLLLPDGTVRWILSSAVIFRTASGAPVRAVGLDMDITSQRRLQEQMEHALFEARDLRARLLELTNGAEALLALRDEASARAGVLQLTKQVLPGDAYAIWWFEPGPDVWRIVRAEGLSDDYVAQRVSGDTGRFVRPLAIDDVMRSDLLAGRHDAHAAEGIASMLTIPLPIRGERRASLVVYHRTPHRSSETELRVGMALGQLAAAALGNAETNAAQDRSRIAAERHAARMAYLADASALLGRLDYEGTLREIAQMAVPRIADWCAVDLLDADGRISRIVTAHVDPDRIELAQIFQDRYPEAPDALTGVGSVLRTGRAEFYARIEDEILAQSAQDAEHLRMMRELGLRSILIAPLIARGRTLGAITFVTSTEERELSDDDVTVLTEVARRAALAIDNARLYREAEVANQAKDDFLALLSHELRTPLNAIMGWSHMLRQGLPDHMRAHAVEVISRNAHSQKQLVEDLLDVARISGGRIDLQRAPLDLRDVGRTAVDSAVPQAAAKEIQLSFSCSPRKVTVFGDIHRLQQTIANLLSNAIKFSESGGNVVVQVSETSAGAELSVTDDGIGIAPEFLPYIFDRFRQADTSLTRNYAGLGLGLWIVKQIVDAHGGRVRAESAGPGRGATVTVTLPASF